jgi:hypothetical protein
MNGAQTDAFSLAHSVYASGLRPQKLDEIRARVLGGEPAPEMATKDLKDLADVRAGIVGEDAASRQLLASLSRQFDLQGILVVSRAPAVDADAGTNAQARLFLPEQGDFDAAKYEYNGSWQATVASVSARFPAVAASVQQPPPPVLVPGAPLPRGPVDKKEEKSPFYKSPWLWGAIGAALLIGGIFFFASQDKSGDPIHVRMTVPQH